MVHIVWILSNSSSAPYFNWFAEKAQLQNTFKFSFICMYHSSPKMLEDMKIFNCDCYWIPYNAAKRKTELIKAFFSIYKLLKKIKPDVVHTHLFDDSLSGLLAAKIAGIKKRFITKGDTGFHYFYTPKWVLFDRLNNSSATKVIAISEQNKKFIQDVEGCSVDKVELIHHGIPIDKATNQNEKTKNDFLLKYKLQGKFVIGTISRLIDWKGHKYIIEAATAVVKDFPNVIFLFIGRGDNKLNLQKQLQEKGLKKYFIFIDTVEPEDIPSVYGTFHLFLHAASFEPFGFVIAEAMVNGVPIVSTCTGAAADILVNNKNGILISEKNAVELAAGILETIKNYKNALERSAVAQKEAEEMFNFNLMWDKHIALYKREPTI